MTPEELEKMADAWTDPAGMDSTNAALWEIAFQLALFNRMLFGKKVHRRVATVNSDSTAKPTEAKP